ncbi:MAG: glycosyltransferase family 4 protein [Thermoplasmata archaeon]|nr:glycosyltransferase family 4 protein [Thermoplasmata archaeon]
MKLAQLSTRYPPGPGGVERHVAEISRRLVARGHPVTAYATDLYQEYPWRRLEPSVPREEVVQGVRVRRLPAWTLPGEFHYPFFRGLPRALDADRPDLLHAHTYGTHHAAAARKYGRSHGVPYVLTAHFHPIWSIHGGWLRHRLRSFYDHRLAAPIVADAATLIVQTHEEERLIREIGLELPKVATIPPGYTPLPDPTPGDRPFSRSIGIEGPFVLFVGRLASNKGLGALVDAFSSLHRSDPTACLVLVGEDGGELERVTSRVRQKGLGEWVRTPGFLSDERMLAAAFRESRVFALPSEYEAFGLVLLEAMAQGTPVVASRVGGIPEFVEDGIAGLLVAPSDVNELAQALQQLWNDPERRRRLGDYGRDVVVPRYSWDRVVDALEVVYREATAG